MLDVAQYEACSNKSFDYRVLRSTRKEGETINSTGVTSGNRSEVMRELARKYVGGGVINGVSNPHKYLPAPQEPSRTSYVSLRENVVLQALTV